jgi:hypothetical protein
VKANKRPELNEAYEQAQSKSKKNKVELVTANFKDFFANKSKKLIDLQKLLEDLQDEASIFRLSLAKKESESVPSTPKNSTGFENQNTEKVNRKERLESLDQEISRVKSQISILMEELSDYSEGNLRKFRILDTTARRILEIETRKTSDQQKHAEAIIAANGIDPKNSPSLAETIDFYRQHRQVYFHLHKYIKTQTKHHKKTWMKQTIDKRLKKSLGNIAKGVYINSTENQRGETQLSEEAVVNAFSQNVTEMKRLNGVLNLAIEENNGLYEDSQRLMAKYTAAERALDEERTQSLKMEEQLLYLRLDAASNETKIAELETKIRQKKKKIEKLKAAKAKLMQENAELKAKLDENMVKVGVTLIQMADLSQRNMILQSQFDSQNKNFYAMAEEATLIKARYHDIQQENNIIEKLLRINTDKLGRKEAELADLQRQFDNTSRMIDKTNKNLKATGGVDAAERRRSVVNSSQLGDPQSLMTAKDSTLRTRSKSPILGIESGLLGTSLPHKRNSAQITAAITQMLSLTPKPHSVRVIADTTKDRFKATTQEVIRERPPTPRFETQTTPRKSGQKNLEKMLEQNDGHFDDIVDADDQEILRKLISETTESPQKVSGIGSTLAQNSEEGTIQIES